MYLRFRGPSYSTEERRELAAAPFGRRVAEILNRLFGSKLSCWDVDVCIGRNPVPLVPLGHRTLAAELWRNPGLSYDHMARELAEQLLGQTDYRTGWLAIALRIALLFGIYGQLPTEEPTDISVIAGDFAAPVSACYAKQWGLPIGKIICCCNENSGLWELLYHGQLRTDATNVRTVIPEADVALPEQLERLVFEAGGEMEVARYLEVCRRGGTYTPSDPALAKLGKDFRVSVVSSSRVGQTISSVYRTHNYVLCPGESHEDSTDLHQAGHRGVYRALRLCVKSRYAADRYHGGAGDSDLRDLSDRYFRRVRRVGGLPQDPYGLV